MLETEEIAIVQGDWEKVSLIAAQAATLFYDRLFTLDPSLRALFVSDLEEQKVKLVQMLTVAVNSLHKVDDLVPALHALGARHIEYGVRPDHYDTVGEALIWTLGKGLGDAFDADHERAWKKTYALVATTMLNAPRT